MLSENDNLAWLLRSGAKYFSPIAYIWAWMRAWFWRAEVGEVATEAEFAVWGMKELRRRVPKEALWACQPLTGFKVRDE